MCRVAVASAYGASILAGTRAAHPCLLPTTMSTMDPPTPLINALYSFSFTTSLLASDLSTPTPTYQACVDAAAEFKKEADHAHALFAIAIQSARNAMHDVKEEQADKENQCEGEGDGGEGTQQGEAGTSTHGISLQPSPMSAAAGSPKRKLVPWSERVAKDVEFRLQTRIVPNIQRGFQAYLETQVIPGLEERVIRQLGEQLRNRPPVSVLQDLPLCNKGNLTLEPPPYDAHDGATSSPTRQGKRSRSEFSPAPDNHSGMFAFLACLVLDAY